jgi:hypothetical protein
MGSGAGVADAQGVRELIDDGSPDLLNCFVLPWADDALA